MKKIILISLFAGLLFGWSACTDDSSSMGSGLTADEITVEGLATEGLDVRSFQGVNLKDLIKPTIITAIPEEQLSYAWYLYGEESKGGYKDHLIVSGKEVDYEVNLPSGSYTLVFEVTNTETGYAKLAEMTIRTTTSFSKGFYIMKETEDGNTELDLLNDDGLLVDLISGISGTSLQGKPYGLSMLYDGWYINTETNAMDHGAQVFVMTDAGQIKGYLTEDMSELFNNDNLFYSGTMPANERIGNFVDGPIFNLVLSNTGVLSHKASGYGGSTGKLGYPIGAGASKYVQVLNAMIGYIYWSDSEHGLRTIDYNVYSPNVVEPANGVEFPDDLECIASGTNVNAGTPTAWFLCEQPSTGDRYLLKTATTNYVDAAIKVDPSSHLAHSTQQSFNGLSASYIYCIDNGKAYAYSLEDGTERDVPTPGIPSGENIIFISNQWLRFGSSLGTTYNFDNLIVGTQTGSTYKLYFYDGLNGGLPVNAATKTAEGTGKVKSVRFISPIIANGMDFAMGELNPFPLSD